MKKIFYGWWVVFGCFFIGLYVGSIIVYGFTCFIQPIRNESGWSYTQISLAASLRALEMGMLAPVAGFLVDRYGGRKLILGGTILIGAGLLLLSLAQSLAFFYGCFLILGLGASGCMPVVTMSVVANWFKKKVGLALGLMASGMGASGLMIPLMVRLMDTYGWRSTSIILGLGMWVIGIPLALVIRSRPEPYGYLPDGRSSEKEAPQLKTQPEGKEIPFKEAVRGKTFFYVNTAEAIRMLTVSAVVTHIMPYLDSLGIPRGTAGLVAGAVSLCSIIGRFGFGWLGDLFDKRFVMACSFLSLAAGLFTLCYVKTPWVLFLFLLLFPAGFGGGMVLRGAILRERFGRQSFGKLVGITMGAAAIGEVMGPALSAWSHDTLGAYDPIWFAFSGAVGLAIILISRIR
jgi:MFS family permease